MNKTLRAIALMVVSTIAYADFENSNLLTVVHASDLISINKSHSISSTPLNIDEQIIELKRYKDRLSELSLEHKWPRLPTSKLLRFGDSSVVIPELRKRLMLLGDLEKLLHCELSDPLFGIDLHNALIKFQARHGLKADGIYGPATRRALNISPANRALQISVNIERLRSFMPESDRFILVNIPAFNLKLFEHGVPILSMKTIVGKKKRKTPVFNTTVNRIVVNPSWHVPKSIAFKDIVPELENDESYLKKMNLKLVSGWGEKKTILAQNQLDLDKLYKGDNYQRFWEPPSSDGTLGSVKFLTSGPYSIYLHDTSTKRLFNEDNRAFSSGCIRVEKPRSLANELMRMTHGWPSEKLDPLFSEEQRHTLRMPDAIPLYVTYWTAFIDQNGLNFRNDLYKRDRWELAQLQQAE